MVLVGKGFCYSFSAVNKTKVLCNLVIALSSLHIDLSQTGFDQ